MPDTLVHNAVTTPTQRTQLSMKHSDQSRASSSPSQRTKGRIRVFHLVTALNIGGTENQMVQAALRQHKLGYQVTVGCLRAEGPLLPVLKEAGIPVVEFRKRKTFLSLHGARQLLRLAVFLRSGRFGVLHAHDLWANLLGVPAGWLVRTPVIVSSRRYLADLEWYTPWRNKLIRFIYRLSTRVVVNSRAVWETLVGRDGVAPEKIRVVYNAVDVERFTATRQEKQRLLLNISERSKLVAVLANMYSPVKGHACLISAARNVCQVEPETIFLLIGDGPERPGLESQVKDARLEKNVVFLGRRTDVPELLACCDLSVLPSEAEGLSNARLESMSAGLPVVATSVGGNKEVIEGGTNGLLVPPRSPGDLSAAILRVLQDSRLARKLASAGQDDMRMHFSFDRLIGEFDRLYREALC
jgi:glycosyltransferase involved in cell wall biosynthesis